MPFPDPDLDDLTRILAETHKLAMTWIEERSRRPVAGAALSVPDLELPEHGNADDDVVPAFLNWAGDGIVGNSGPSYFGFVTGGVLPAALAADWMTGVLDQNAASSATSPAAAATEALVVQWMLSLLHLPSSWSGVMTSGGTMSNFIGLAAGRQAVGQSLGFDPTVDGLSGNPPIKVVTSTEVHSSAVKSLGALGLGRGVIIPLPAPNGSIDTRALEDCMREQTDPFIIIANAGEVNTGQFDDLESIVRLRNELSPSSWIHVDGAFGAFAGVSPSTRSLLVGVEQANSVAADGHKWLNVPYDAGFIFFRDARAAQGAFAIDSAYQARSGGFDADSVSLEFSRRFRALPAWSALHSLGRQGFRDVIERSLETAALLMELIEADEGVELVNREGQLGNPFCIVAFRIVHSDWNEEETDRANRTAVDVINTGGSSYVSGTKWQNRPAIRAAFVNWQTREEHVRQLFADVQSARQQLIDNHKQDG